MRALLRWLLLLACAFAALQLFFVLRIALMAVLAPESTSFQRSQAWSLVRADGKLTWRQQWVAYDQISDHLKRAVIAAEDDGFARHEGVEWGAMEKAWERNARQAARSRPDSTRAPRLRGGSTITQQLAKNLLLSGERTLLRKSQELVLAFALERLLSKQRILEIYLNNVEWGAGVFGAEAAAQHYYRKSARALSASEAARLAVMLPAPRRFEKTPASPYLAARSRALLARMGRSELP
ncbi:monofunctional biosynthetic peptidoglycan transglycosylase [Melaminivora jejuensis]|uniref:monofunctional biosynthetic peptidoglycan transglycosylase n=1 Tax=Melaminivora jejuensis TaxID=1267217 RepID=UPI001ADF27BE|nr:monofunctional biosynthetic peptidoglycan transglycosylase [Melaminivora jejuensis]UHJ65536.1 monofunctional biosynthetic peptidoglycan transglycosylase [Melaminivora jejuensis]